MEIFGRFISDKKNGIYKFNVNRVITWSTDYELLRIVGDHVKGKENENVEALSFNKFKINQIPKNIDRFFPNLKKLTINNCAMKNISKNDLSGLIHLKQLTLNGNLLTHLPNNLFENTTAIETVSLHSNRIEFIGPNTFESLKHLKCVNLRMNVNIDACFKPRGGVTFEEMQKIIQDNCQDHLKDLIDYFDFENMLVFSSSFKGLDDYVFSLEDLEINF